MPYLIATSLLWAFSFGLIKGQLTGVDPNFVAFARLGLSTLVFLPFLRWRGMKASLGLRLMGIGGVQFGLMYVLYIRSYGYLAAHEVALFTVLTPLYIALFARQGLRRKAVGGALVACVGAAVIAGQSFQSQIVWTGFLLVQGANVCFALGQLAFKRLEEQVEGQSQASLFSLMSLGGCLVAGLVSSVLVDWSALEVSGGQRWTLLYLGVLPSGLGFFLWNFGVTRITEAALAVMNNVKVPLGVLVSLVCFGESAQWGPLVLGSCLLAGALLLVRKPSSIR